MKSTAELDAAVVGTLAEKRGLSDRVERRITDIIISGRLPPGAELGEQALADQLGVSRTPIRDALKRLELLGLVVREPRKRARVAELSPEIIKNSYVCRAYLSGLAVKLAAFRAGPSECQMLDDILTKMKRAEAGNDVAGYFQEHARFHEMMVRIADNDLLESQIVGLGLTTLRIQRISLDIPSRIENSLRAHVSLFEHFKVGDGEGAETIVRCLLADSAAAVIQHMFGEDRGVPIHRILGCPAND